MTCLPNFEKRKVKETALVDHHTGRQSEKSIGINPLATASYNHGKNSWDTFAFVGFVFNSHMTDQPPLPPPPRYRQRCTCVSRIFFLVLTLCRVREERISIKFRKGCTVFFIRVTRNYRKQYTVGAYIWLSIYKACVKFFYVYLIGMSE